MYVDRYRYVCAHVRVYAYSFKITYSINYFLTRGSKFL